MIDRSLFFAGVRGTLFAGRLHQSQVDGMTGILDEWQRRGLSDLRWLAYMLATTRHETARTMQPIAEIGRGRGRRYGRPDPVTGQTYYGRGLVQLTWKANYARAGDAVGADLVRHPERAMRSDIAVKILFDGMIDGWFAGDRAGPHALPRWFNAGANDPENARRIINGTDRASQLAGHHRLFLDALVAAASPSTGSAPQPRPPAPIARALRRLRDWVGHRRTRRRNTSVSHISMPPTSGKTPAS